MVATSFGAPAQASPRPTDSAAARGLVRCGSARVALSGLGGLLGGTVREWRDPWFVIDCDDGSQWHVQPRGLLDVLLFNPTDFYDPSAFQYDWTRLNPMRILGWRVGLAAALDEAGLVIPKPWLQRETEPGDAGRPTATTDLRAAERQSEQARLDDILAHLSGDMRAKRTLDNLRNPGLKLIWWLSSRGHALNPPTPHALASYQAVLFDDRGNLGAMQQAREALNLLGKLNAWPPGLKEGVASVPIDAARRLFRHQVRKVRGLERIHVEAIFVAYVWWRPGVGTEHQWELAVGLAIVVGYKVWARYNDLAQMRFDDDFCIVFATHIDFKIPHRKNKQFLGDTVTVARPAVRGAYHALLEAKARVRRLHPAADQRQRPRRPLPAHALRPVRVAPPPGPAPRRLVGGGRPRVRGPLDAVRRGDRGGPQAAAAPDLPRGRRRRPQLDPRLPPREPRRPPPVVPRHRPLEERRRD